MIQRFLFFFIEPLAKLALAVKRDDFSSGLGSSQIDILTEGRRFAANSSPEEKGRVCPQIGFLQAALIILSISNSVFAEDLTIDEKKQAVLQEGFRSRFEKSEDGVFERIQKIKQELYQIQREVQALSQEQQDLGEEEKQNKYASLHARAKQLKLDLDSLQNTYTQPPTDFSIWHAPEITILQLIMEYGLGDSLYIVPDEIGKIKLSMVSSLSVPSSEWSELLRLILNQQGIGVRKLNSYCNELYRLDESSSFDVVTDLEEDLWTLAEGARVCFITDGRNGSIHELVQTVRRFFYSYKISVAPLGSRVAIFATVHQIRQILRMQEYLNTDDHSKTFKIVSLSKLKGEDVSKMLDALFDKSIPTSSKSSGIKKKNPTPPDAEFFKEDFGLVVMPIEYHNHSAFFLAGHPKEVQEASKLITRLEEEIQNTSSKQLFWYTCRHADPEDTAKIASKIYQMLLQTTEQASSYKTSEKGSSSIDKKDQGNKLLPGNIAPLTVDPAMQAPSLEKNGKIIEEFGEHIVVDAKSGALIMVIEPHLLGRMKELLTRLDQPKRMVRIDFLLFEKQLIDDKHFGMNLLKIGSNASNTKVGGVDYSVLTAHNPSGLSNGIMNFFLSRPKNPKAPAFDLAYNFLLTQDNVQINANPSVVTVNGTESTVNLVDEISISTGPVEWEANGKTQLKDSFSRAQYGITIKVTPQIHESQEGEDYSITLDTDITFDTTRANLNDRPNVTRRNIKNLVRIGNGQTIVLGGLRQKDQDDSQETIPFLGELPGFGKLFSYTTMQDKTTEMFIFITPRVVDDAGQDWQDFQRMILERRPGDSELFIAKMIQSEQMRRSKVFERSLEAIFSRSRKETSRKAAMYEGYDGR